MGALDVLGSRLAQYDLTEAELKRYLKDRLGQSDTDRQKSIKSALEAFSGRGLAQSSANLGEQANVNQTFDVANANLQQEFQTKLREIMLGRTNAQQEYDSTILQEQIRKAQEMANVTPNVPVQSSPTVSSTPENISAATLVPTPTVSAAPSQGKTKAKTKAPATKQPPVGTVNRPRTPIAKGKAQVY